MKINIMEE